MTPYISIDIETTGLDPDYCQILEIGAVIDNWIDPIEQLSRFHCYVLNDQLVGEAYALSMHPVILRRIATQEKGFNYFQPSHIAFEFKLWLEINGLYPLKKHLNVAGKNYGSFDRQFLSKLPNWKSFIKTRHRYIDPGNLYWDPVIDDGLPNMKTCMEQAKIIGEVPHTAVGDALIIIKLIRAWEENNVRQS